MSFAALRTLVRPLTRTLISPVSTSTTPFLASRSIPNTIFNFISSHPRHSLLPPIFSHFHSLTDTRYPKRRPQLKPRRKRASIRPPGPYAWVKYVPGQPIEPNNPNEGSVKQRNEKKRMRQRRAFILAERKKRKKQLQEANRRKRSERVERKMAAVARERAWQERLAELKRLEEEKKKATA